MIQAEYTWICFYTAFADSLRKYKNNRNELIEKLLEVYNSINMKLPTLDAGRIPRDIDPFTVFGLFNKGITDANRKKIIAGMASTFGVEAAQPDDFAGIPVL